MQSFSKIRTTLPELLVLDILSKLPVKSLTRFNCVCKSWSSSFQTPFFITQHHHNNLRNNNLNLLLLRRDGYTLSDYDYFSELSTEKGQNFSIKQNIIGLPFPEYGSPYLNLTCHGSRNGILCLEFGGDIFLWNPSTREFKILPESPIKRPPLADSTSFRSVGFGYDSQTDDYKVLRFVCNAFDYHFDDGSTHLSHVIPQVDLYSLKGNSWKEISDLGVTVRKPYMYDIYVNEFYYWEATGDSSFLILSFDMVNERFSTLPLPVSDAEYLQYSLELLIYNGLLGALVYPMEGTLKSFDLWTMSGSWTKLFCIESVPGVERFLGFWKNDELFLESSDDELMLFDPSTQELKNLGIHACKRTMHIVANVESLVPLNGRLEHGERVLHWPVGGPLN